MPTRFPSAGKRVDQVVIGFSFWSNWLGEWHEFSAPITEPNETKPMQCRITFDTIEKNSIQRYISGKFAHLFFFFVPNKGKPTEASKEMTVKQYGELKTTDFVPGTEVYCSRR